MMQDVDFGGLPRTELGVSREGGDQVRCQLSRPGALADVCSRSQVLSVWNPRQQGTLPLLLAPCALLELPLIAFRRLPSLQEPFVQSESLIRSLRGVLGADRDDQPRPVPQSPTRRLSQLSPSSSTCETIRCSFTATRARYVVPLLPNRTSLPSLFPHSIEQAASSAAFAKFNNGRSRRSSTSTAATRSPNHAAWISNT